jgi:hypothetical protein
MCSECVRERHKIEVIVYMRGEDGYMSMMAIVIHPLIIRIPIIIALWFFSYWVST